MSDITDFGFDASLNIPSKDTGTPLIYDGVSDAIQAQQLASGGNLTLKNLTISGISKMVAPGDDLQQALNEINAAGGGTLLMKAGTYTQRTPLVGYSNTSIEGISTSTIINFQGSANLSFTGTQVYTTGTVTGIASNVIVSGSGTSWLTKAAAGMQIFLGTRWYKIGSVSSDTQLILAEGYGDNLIFPTTYRIANPIVGLLLKEITLQNSTGTALSITDQRTIIMQNVKAVSNNIGMALTNMSEYDFKNVSSFTCTSDGIQITNGGLGTVEGMITAGNGGNGVTLNNVKTVGYSFCSSDANVGDGVNMTTVVGCEFAWECSGNGGQGIEMVVDCSSNFVNPCVFTGNGSDGLKLTSNCDGNILGPLSATGNGGYGINIANSNCDNNTIVVPYFSGNSSGTYNDSGTNTNIVATVPANISKFGGDGSDGALSISSGTTTLSCGSSDILVKNYTSISITGTGKLAFSNPGTNGTVIFLKSQGAVVLTSSAAACIDASAMGASAGNTGTFSFGNHAGGNPVYNGAVGAGGAARALVFSQPSNARMKTVFAQAGAGGSNAANTGGTGAGGRGGGGLVIECKGDLNFTGTVSVAGANGSNGTINGDGGGGGGASGIAYILYTTATATSGTINSAGGSGGNNAGLGGTDAAGRGGSGGGAKDIGATGGSPNGGNAGSNGSGGGGAGGGNGTTGGAGGASWGGIVAQNTEFV